MPDNASYPPRRAARTTAERLREALSALAEGHGTVERQTECAWASITFEGARHTVELAFAGPDAVEAGERFVAALPDHEFAIPGHLVAEATIVEVDHRLIPEPRMAVRCELLLLKGA